MKHSWLVPVLGVFFFGGVTSAFADTCCSFVYSGGSFSSIDYPVLSFPYPAPFATGINNGGQIVGFLAFGGGAAFGTEGFVDTGGNFTVLNVPNSYTGYLGLGGGTVANGINNSGEIVGSYYDSTGTRISGFLDNGGVFTTITVAANTNTFATGINDNGQIVGYAAGSGFLDTGGLFSSIKAPGASFTAATGINDNGQIVGYYRTSSGGEYGFLDTGGVFTSISVPGASATKVEGINDNGQVVGYYYTAANPSVAIGFLLSGSNFTSFVAPGGGVTGTYAMGINNNGVIVGSTPEPGTFALVALCLLGLFATARARFVS